MTYYYCNPDELYHYGVKGMKWGVRHDRQPTGNRRRGLTDKQKKAIKVGAIAIGSALAMYGGYKIYKATGRRPSSMLKYGVSDSLEKTLSRYPSKDISLKANTKLQRVSQDSYEDLTNKGYTYLSYKFRDKQRYLSGFRNEINRNASKDFVHKIVPKERLNIASPGTAAREYLKINPKASDETFRMVVNPYSTPRGNSKLATQINSQRTELFKSLKSKGYSGIVDIEDASKSKGSEPLIIFDPDKHITVKKSKKIGKAETFVATILK